MRRLQPEHQLLVADVHVLLRPLRQILLQHLPLQRPEEAQQPELRDRNGPQEEEDLMTREICCRLVEIRFDSEASRLKVVAPTLYFPIREESFSFKFHFFLILSSRKRIC